MEGNCGAQRLQKWLLDQFQDGKENFDFESLYTTMSPESRFGSNGKRQG